MLSFPFRVAALNAHYLGTYGVAEMAWRRINAIDKADNIETLLSAEARRPMSVLEVGCGTGALMAELASRPGFAGASVCGIDVADPAEHPDPRAVAQGLSMERYDGIRLPYDDASFDLVIASHVLEHVPDERGFLAELSRVSRQLVYIEVPCELHIRTTLAALQSTLNIGHINAYTPASFALTLETSGLMISNMDLFDHSFDYYRSGAHRFHSRVFLACIKMMIRRFLLSLSRGLASRLFTYHCGALCKRTDS
jgi:SAM-dependent methyltransferase